MIYIYIELSLRCWDDFGIMSGRFCILVLCIIWFYTRFNLTLESKRTIFILSNAVSLRYYIFFEI